MKWLHPRAQLILHEGGRIVRGEHEPAWERIIYPWFLRAACKSTDVFLANSRYTLGHLEAAGLRGRIPSRVVYNSILTEIPGNDDGRRRKARLQLGLPPGSFAIGFAGRLVERKGWRDFIACAEHFRERRDVHWLVAGSGAELPMAERMLAERNLPHVRLLGFQADMDSFYRALDLCVVPSHWEPHGLVQIEAQGRGVPVVATNVPGMAETLQDGQDALLFEPQNLPQLFACVDRMLASPALRAQLAAGALANARRFTIGQYEEQLESCYRLL
jgi:glycosyltransferase involved in cell wall biosynthesis